MAVEGEDEVLVDNEQEQDDDAILDAELLAIASESEEKNEESIPVVKVETPVQPPVQPSVSQTKRPEGWKPDILEIFDKANSGQPVDQEEVKKLLAYVSTEREADFKGKIAVHESLANAVDPFMVEYKRRGLQVDPAQFIQNLGNAHFTMATGTHEQKVALFTKLANDYGVPLQDLLGGQEPDQPGQYDQMLRTELQELRNETTTLSQWREQQAVDQATAQVDKILNDKVNFPFAEEVRGKMGQLIETGLVNNLEDAYNQAVWLLPDVRGKEQARLLSVSTSAQQVEKAKSAGVSVKTSSPKGTPGKGKDTSDADLDRELLEIYNEHK